MNAIRTLLVMSAAVLTVGFFLFVGYAIAVRDTGPALLGLVLLALGAAAVFVQSRLPDPSAGH